MYLLLRDIQEVANTTLQTLKSLRSDSNSKLFWENVIKLAEKEDISKPEVPHHKRVPRGIDYSTAEGVSAATPVGPLQATKL